MKTYSWLYTPLLLPATWVFLKIGLVFFGGGYVVIPVMHRELVTNLHWLTQQEFIDGTAISQLTPGPIAILATFAGYKISGILGALSATIALFLPGSIAMVFISRGYETLRNKKVARNVMDLLVPVVVGALIAASWTIGKDAIRSIYDIVICVIALVAIIRYKVNPAILILAAALLGLLLHYFSL